MRESVQSSLTSRQQRWREERLPEIEAIAYRELALYEQKFGEISGEVIPIENLVRDLWGLIVVPVDLQSGEYEVPQGTEAILDHSKRLILLDINGTEVQRRYTLACEGGHWVLHRANRLPPDQLQLLPSKYLYPPDPEPGWEHRESQYFAACILMPRHKFEPLARKFLENATLDDHKLLLSEVIETLAVRFNVAKQTAKIRLEELHLVTPAKKGWFECRREESGPLFER